MSRSHVQAILCLAVTTAGCKWSYSRSVTSGACAHEAEADVDRKAEAGDVAFDQANHIDCPTIRRQVACDSEPGERTTDRQALAALRAELPDARATRAELVALLSQDDTDTSTSATVLGSMLCDPLEREIATRRFLALHPERHPLTAQAGGAP